MVSDPILSAVIGSGVAGALAFAQFIYRQRHVRQQRPAEVYLERKADYLIGLHDELAYCLHLAELVRRAEYWNTEHDRPDVDTQSIGDELEANLEKRGLSVEDYLDFKGGALSDDPSGLMRDMTPAAIDDLPIEEFSSRMDELEILLQKSRIFLDNDDFSSINILMNRLRLLAARVHLWAILYAPDPDASDESLHSLSVVDAVLESLIEGYDEETVDFEESVIEARSVLKKELNEPVDYFFND